MASQPVQQLVTSATQPTTGVGLSLDDEIPAEMIELIVNGVSFIVEKSVLLSSIFIKDTLDFSKETKIEINLPQKITDPKQTMEWVIEYMTYHNTTPVSQIQLPLVSDNIMESGVTQWDNDFISKSDQEIVNLSQAAHYLHIPSLHQLSCAKIGSIMKHIVKQYSTKDQQIAALKKRWNGTDV